MTPDIVIAIPTLDEEATIGGVLAHFLGDHDSAVIVVADGGSSDDTLRIVQGIAAQDSRVRLIHNPDGCQAAGVNRAARLARSFGARIMIRADAHALYPRGFVRGLAHALDHSRADSVVVPLLAEGHGPGWQGANAALQRTWLGHGGAAHRQQGPTRPVAHGHHAAFRLSAFLALGGYDPEFLAAEDVEFDHRLIAAGGRLVLNGQWPVRYLPRVSPGAAFRQFLRNGRFRTRFWRKHRTVPALRQILPMAAGIGWVPSLIVGTAWPAAAAPGLAYLALTALLAGYIGRAAPVLSLRVFLLALLSHGGFALGAARGCVEAVRPSRTREATA